MAKQKVVKYDIMAGWSQFVFLQNAHGLLFAPLTSIDLIAKRFIDSISDEPDEPEKKTSSKRKAGANDESDFIAYKFLGTPDDQQANALSRNIGGARWMWNRLKGDNDTLYNEIGKCPQNTPADYKDLDGLEWLKELDSLALSNAQLNFERAMRDWFSGAKGRPHFKKKRKCKASYTTNCVGNNIRLTEDGLVLPKIPGKIILRAHREIRPNGKLKSVTVWHAPNGKWYFTILFEYPRSPEAVSQGLDTFYGTDNAASLKHIGLDMSLPHFYVDSNGRQPSYIVNNVIVRFEKAYHALEKRIAREQRKLSHMVFDSNNYARQCEKIAKLHAKAKQQRDDFVHQIAARLARTYDIISIEDLDMAAMKRALNFGKSVSDNGWGNFVRFLEEKCRQYGCMLIRVDKWFPSSKTCCHCGHIHKELTLSDREYVCPACGHHMDRDHQAAVNIDREGMRLFLDITSGTYNDPEIMKKLQPVEHRG